MDWKSVDSNYEIVHWRRVIVTRFHRQRDIRDTLSRATLSLGKSLPDNVHVCQTFDEFPAPRAPRIYATDFAALSRANTIYTHTHTRARARARACVCVCVCVCIYVYRYVATLTYIILSAIYIYIHIWHFYQLCQNFVNLDTYDMNNDFTFHQIRAKFCCIHTTQICKLILYSAKWFGNCKHIFLILII